MQAIQEDYYFQMYFDLLPIWGFIGTVEKVLRPGTTEFQHKLFTHSHFDVHFNSDRVIEIVLTPRNEEDAAVDVSEGTVEQAGQGGLEVEFTYSVSWHETRRPFAQRLEHYEQHRHDPIHLEVCASCLRNKKKSTTSSIGTTRSTSRCAPLLQRRDLIRKKRL